MDIKVGKRISRYIVIGSLSIIVLLVLVQIGLYWAAQKNPNLFADTQGIAQNLSKKIRDAQSSYRDTHGHYAKNSKKLNVEIAKGYYFGYAHEVPNEIRSLCEECNTHNDGYNMLLVFRADGSVFKFNDSKEVIQLK